MKGQKVCCYQHCPSPQHSSKWRFITPGTSAGGQVWNDLTGQTLCDSCYSTYRKHGTNFGLSKFCRIIPVKSGCEKQICSSREIACGQAPLYGLCARMRAGSASMRRVPSPQASSKSPRRPRMLSAGLPNSLGTMASRPVSQTTFPRIMVCRCRLVALFLAVHLLVGDCVIVQDTSPTHFAPYPPPYSPSSSMRPF
jgi:hypothetical protein